MRVLFLLSCLEPAGSETYCLTLAKAWGGRHTVHWISDSLHYGQSYTAYPISQKAFPGGIRNTWNVLKYVRDQGIELIHSHSRRAHWVAAQVAKFAKIPHVTTIHQPPPVHIFSRLFPCLGDHTIAIDEAVVEHLNKYFSRGIRAMSLIRNGIELRAPFSAASPDSKGDSRVLYLGRLTGGRWRALQFFFNTLKRSGASFPKTCFQIVGRVPEFRARELQDQINAINSLIKPSFIETHDFVGELATFIAGARGVIAGGRSAMESLAAEKPVIALGEKGVIGLCGEDTWKEILKTNFGDHFAGANDQFYPAKLEFGLRQILGSGDVAAIGRWGRAQVERDYNIQNVAAAVDQVYREVA